MINQWFYEKLFLNINFCFYWSLLGKIALFVRIFQGQKKNLCASRDWAALGNKRLLQKIGLTVSPTCGLFKDQTVTFSIFIISRPKKYQMWPMSTYQDKKNNNCLEKWETESIPGKIKPNLPCPRLQKMYYTHFFI